MRLFLDAILFTAAHNPGGKAARGCPADGLLTGDIRDFGFLMNDRKKAGGLLIQIVADFLKAI